MANNRLPNPPIDDDTPVVVPPGTVIKTQRRNMTDVIQDVFTKLGGAESLAKWAESSTVNQRIFYGSIMTKIIPKQTELSGKDGGAINVNMTGAHLLKGLSDQELETWLSLVKKTQGDSEDGNST